MEIDDIIKILLVALLILPGLFGAKHKKKENRKESELPEPTKITHSDPFENFGKDWNNNEELETEPYTENAVSELDTISDTEGMPVFSQERIKEFFANSEKNVADGNISGSKIGEIGSETEDITSENDLLTDFDAKKAFIYSEILTSKYNC